MDEARLRALTHLEGEDLIRYHYPVEMDEARLRALTPFSHLLFSYLFL